MKAQARKIIYWLAMIYIQLSLDVHILRQEQGPKVTVCFKICSRINFHAMRLFHDVSKDTATLKKHVRVKIKQRFLIFLAWGDLEGKDTL